jgi:threonine/homoserine/homoserine lactone efflux protein
MQRALQFGRQAGLIVGISHGIGILFYAGTVALGAATLQSEFPQIFRGLQIIGLGFLGYLGLTMLRGGWRKRSTKRAADTRPLTQKSRPSLAAEGFLIVFFNPKIAIFFFAIFSQFLLPDLSPYTRTAMASLAAVIDALWYCAIAALVSLPVIEVRLQQYAWQLDIAFGAALITIMLVLI